MRVRAMARARQDRARLAIRAQNGRLGDLGSMLIDAQRAMNDFTAGMTSLRYAYQKALCGPLVAMAAEFAGQVTASFHVPDRLLRARLPETSAGALVMLISATTR
jgi:hypothetical protein